MTALGLPVPAGFTITTDACRAYMAAGDAAGRARAGGGRRTCAALEEKTGKRFGDADDPLLVSVRSGAAISMPGMMDTILNLGLNDQAVEGLAARTGNRRFAYDSYRRLIQMFGEVVDGIDAHAFEDALTALKRERGVAARHRPRRRRPAPSSSAPTGRSTASAEARRRSRRRPPSS